MAFKSLFYTARSILYPTAALFALASIISAIVLIAKTEHEVNSYFDSSVELLVAAILFILLMVPIHYLYHVGNTRRSMLGHLLVELVALATFWLLFLGGAASLSQSHRALDSNYHYGSANYSICSSYTFCSAMSALLAFAWLTWITLSALLIIATVYGVQNKSWSERMEGQARVGPNAGVGGVGQTGVAAPVGGVVPMTQHSAHTTTTTTNAVV